MSAVVHTPERELRHAPYGDNKTAKYDFYKGTGRHAAASDVTVIMLHGWLGSETMNYIAQHVAAQGHDVAVPLYDHSFSLSTLLGPNKRRSQTAHAVTKHATIQTGKNQVVILDHSNGNQDALHLAERSAGNTATYKIRAIGAVAGVGMNGHNINFGDVLAEAAEHIHLLTHHPKEELRVVGHSLKNYLRNPLLAIEEGLVAARIDCAGNMRKLVDSGVVGQVLEVYMDHDRLVPPAAGRGLVMSGSHMTPVVQPDIMIHVANTLAYDS